MRSEGEPHRRVALVTGSASGMGAACARRLAEDADLVLFDVDADQLDEVARASARDEAPPEVVVGDITSSEHVEVAVRRGLERFGRLDVLINAAGIAEATRFFDVTPDEWRRVLDVNLFGAFLMTRAVARPMRDHGWGRIVHFSSTAGKTVSTLGGVHYTASKHGVLGLVRGAAKELAPFGITVNAVCPGLIDTPMVRSFTTEKQRAAYADSFPISRLGAPDEVAELVAFLASDAAGYITGAAVDINGGDLMI